jgi:hypothetical protein
MKSTAKDFSQLADLLTTQKEPKLDVAELLGIKAKPTPLQPTHTPASEPVAAPVKQKKKKKKYEPKVSQDLVFKACHTFTAVNVLADHMPDVIEGTHFYTKEQKVIAKRIASDCAKIQELKFSEVLNNNVATASYVQVEENYLDIQQMLSALNSFEQGLAKQVLLAVFFNDKEIETLNIKELLSLVETINDTATRNAKLLDRLNNLKKARAIKAANRNK